MATIKIGIDDGGLQRKLNALEAAATDKTSLYAAIGAALRTRILRGIKICIDPCVIPRGSASIRGARRGARSGSARRPAARTSGASSSPRSAAPARWTPTDRATLASRLSIPVHCVRRSPSRPMVRV
mgnify:CR=1 FL=1